MTVFISKNVTEIVCLWLALWHAPAFLRPELAKLILSCHWFIVEQCGCSNRATMSPQSKNRIRCFVACAGNVVGSRGGTISNCGSISISIFSKISFSISRSISILSLKNNQDQYQYQDQYFFQTQYQYQDQYSLKI